MHYQSFLYHIKTNFWYAYITFKLIL